MVLIYSGSNLSTLEIYGKQILSGISFYLESFSDLEKLDLSDFQFCELGSTIQEVYHFYIKKFLEEPTVFLYDSCDVCCNILLQIAEGLGINSYHITNET